ncbi:GTP 3',8-cyclase MoaA [Chitinophaga horti]|uniref:GTP 3',8-cyclase n=1 Tax=Chitinophaga horti TaxID=2920382 RepID=A0ABY6IZA4_9BACT|nr:GTP 3',8-cyclase MoaA [Chitinophaga horti]UYQ91409.1 GTP 3',8-cyclase MoaA [Chitinophaga horti]
MLKDGFNRKHDYLRLSLTNNCNLRCTYCMPEESYTHWPAASMMQADEIISLVKTFVAMGVNKVRLTGGEPLVRKDAPQILLALSELPIALAITTNGTRLAPMLPVLQQTNVRTINVSLDTLQADKYLLLTRRDLFNTVYHNIYQLLEQGIRVKINMVVMKGVNENELPAFVEWTRHLPINVRFIEFMPFDGNRWSSNRVFTHEQMLANIAEHTPFDGLPSAPHDTARHFQASGHTGTFSIISSMSAPFCSTCNRLRLTADGKLKNCLFSTSETDLLTALRAGQNVQELILQNLAQKAKERGGQFGEDFADTVAASLVNRSMIAIGG